MIHIFRQNLQCGLHLVPIAMGTKAPRHKSWNQPGHSLSLADFQHEIDPLNGLDPATKSWGIHHVDSRTCALDIDNLKWARYQFWLEGLNLDYYLQTYVGVDSGAPNHAKLIFKLPPGMDPPVSKQVYGKAQAGKPFASFNFRCATSTGSTTQDVAPPSLHPTTWECYRWVNDGGHGSGALQYLPPELHRFWLSLSEEQATPARDARPAPTSREGQAESLKVQSALEMLDPDMGRVEWIEIGMAVHEALGDGGRDVFEAWSSEGSKYDSRQIQAEWASFHDHPNGISRRTLYDKAIKDGWIYADPEAELEERWMNSIHPRATGKSLAEMMGWEPTLAEMMGWDKKMPGTGEPPANAAVPNTPTRGESEEEKSRSLIEDIRRLGPVSNFNPGDVRRIQEILLPTVRFKNTGFRDSVAAVARDAMGWTVRQLKDNLAFVLSQSNEMMGDSAAEAFPFVNEAGTPLDHPDNLRVICKDRGIQIRHNRMSHGFEVQAREKGEWYEEEKDNNQISYIKDTCIEHRMPHFRAEDHIRTLASENTYHPMEAYLDDVVWDGRDWFETVANTVQTTNPKLWRVTLLRWALSVAAAVKDQTGNRPPRGVLVMTGKQLAGKTSWFRYLTPAGMFAEGANLNPADKDSVKKATKYAIVELGELDSTFHQSHTAKLKAFLSASYDEIRLPYAHSESYWKRRTIFCGTVNDPAFLKDKTGNTRFWVNEISDIRLDAIEGMALNGGVAQFWAQINHWLQIGIPWTPTKEEYDMINRHNMQYTEYDMYEEMLLDHFAFVDPATTVGARPRMEQNNPMKLDEIARMIGLEVTTRPQDMQSLRAAIVRLTGQTHSLVARRRCWDHTRNQPAEMRLGRWFYMPMPRHAVPVTMTTTPKVVPIHESQRASGAAGYPPGTPPMGTPPMPW